MPKYLNPMMVEWFNEWQSFPDKLGITPEIINDKLLSKLGDNWDSRRESLQDLNETEKAWLFFFMSMFIRYRYLTSYSIWIEGKMELYDDMPGMGINLVMCDTIMKNYQSDFKKPFNTTGYSWHNEIMFIIDINPPAYPPLKGLKGTLDFINWMWDSPFTLK